MKLCHRAASFLALLSVAVGALAAAPVYSPREPQREDSNALIMTAEIALRRDNCGRAADSYAIAAQRLADVRLAARATEVALDCGQFSVAERAVARWRELAPAEPATLHAAMRAQLGLYKIDEARNTFQTWLRSASTAREHGAADEISQLAQQSGASSTFAMVRMVDEQSLRQPASQLALAALAYDNWNYRAALQYAQRALGSGAARGTTEALIARAHAGLGEADAALEAAQAARTAAPDEQGFVPVDVLLTLGREADARKTLEGLAGNDKLRALAARRLALLAFSRGDYDEAESRFTDLLNDREAEAVAVFYLSAIAERRGNDLTALRGYQLLDGTALEAAARARAAAILYKNNEPEQALQMLAAADDASIAAHLEAEIAQAQLLSAQGAANEALARINDALDRSPAHPDLIYQKSILLERSGHTDEAIAQLEALSRSRPNDGAITNALGFILVDHNRDLVRAERLIRSALNAEPDSPAILDSLGWLEFKRGSPREALPLLERAFRLEQDGDIGAHWGEVLWSMGEKTHARQVWIRALAGDPDNALLKAALQRSGGEPPANARAGAAI